MKRIIMYCVVLVIGIYSTNLYAQGESQEQKIEILNAQKIQLEKQEKETLKSEVNTINKRLRAGEISEEEAQQLKEEAAKLTALNIENRLAIINNSLELLKRNEDVDISRFTPYVSSIEIGFKDGNYGLRISNEDNYKTYDRRTHSDLFIAFGLNNAIIEGQSLNDSPYQVGGSRFFEFGWVWSTRIFKNSNSVRFKYGFSFQYNGLKPVDNQYFVDDGANTELATFAEDLDKAKLRMDNLVIPIYFEFGPSKVNKTNDYIRYSTHKKFKFGIGGFAGINLSTRQKLKYELDDKRVKDKLKRDYNTNNLIYGLSGYIGKGDTSLYVKYDLNPIFNDDNNDQRNISLGLRFDL